MGPILVVTCHCSVSWLVAWLTYQPNDMALAASKPNTGWTVILLPLAWLKKDYINTSYLTDSYIGFTLKIESVSKNTFFGLKMMVKSGLEKNILKSLHVGR